MRWYCVHPSLPLQAELRIRAAPDSSAAERGRISQGRAIAACSPVFQVPGDDAGPEPASWLQVAYLDGLSGETEGGFMMAALPDGMALVVPWEETDFSCCCEVRDSAALMYNAPQETAKVLGAVSSVNFLYCVVEDGENRARILHPEFDSVWIDKSDLQIVCARLKHQECSTFHAFYELNEALPEEAQIAIRQFPSKEAQTVGLLSLGETLEVTVRGGNWLQIAGGSVDKAWIMWRTDALELLQEATDVCSSTCRRIATNFDDTANGSAEEDTADNQTGLPFPDTVAAAAVSVIDDEVEGAPVVNDESAAATAAVVSATEVEGDAIPSNDPGTATAVNDEAENSEPIEHSQAWEDRPIWSAQASNEAGGGGTVCDGVHENANSVKSRDDQPIKPAPAVSEQTEFGEEEGTSTAQGAIDDNTLADVSAVGGDMVNRESALPSDNHQSAQSILDTIGSMVGMNTQAIDDETKAAESVQGTPSWDNRPIRPAQMAPEEVVTDDSNAVDPAPDMDDTAALNYGDGGDNDTGPAVNDDEAEEAEPVQAVPAWDDRPIRPAPTAFDAPGDVDNASATKDGELQDTQSVQGTPSWDNRPIRPTQMAPEEVVTDDSNAADPAPDMDDTAALNYGDGGDNDTGGPAVNDDEAEEAEPVQAVPAWDDRPIRPAPTAFDAPGDVDNASATKDGELQDTQSVQGTPSWDNRPIRPTHTLPIDGADGNRIRGVDALDEKLQPGNDCSSIWPTENFDDSSVGVGCPRTRDRHYPNAMNPLGAFERRYGDSKTTSGSESGEIALLGSLEDVFDPVDELLPAMPEDVKGMDYGSSSTAVSESTPADVAIAERGEWSDDDGDLHGTDLAQDGARGEKASPTDGILYLQHVGIGKYCEHKQSLSSPSDELSQVIYEAGQDDADLVFQALVGDAPLSDDWFHDVASRNRLAESHSRVSSTSAQSLARSPRISSSSGPKSTYELIMSDATPEEILESELLDEGDEDYDLISSFKYPLPKRRHLARSGSRTSLLGSQQLTPPSLSAKTSLVTARSVTTPPKNPSSAQFARTPATPEPSNRTRAQQQQPIAAPGNIKKPLGSLARPRSFVSAMPVPRSALAKPARSGLTKPAVPSDMSPSQPQRSLLQRRSFIAAPTSTKEATGSTSTSSILKHADPSGLQMPRKSFGFRRTSSKQ